VQRTTARPQNSSSCAPARGRGALSALTLLVQLLVAGTLLGAAPAAAQPFYLSPSVPNSFCPRVQIGEH
jgi:hypothetical protein